MNPKLQNTLSILTNSRSQQAKIDALLVQCLKIQALVHDCSEEMKKSLNDDDLLYDFIKRRCYDVSDRLHLVCLECTKYWGTISQIQKYRELLDMLFEEGIDLPNTYTYNMNPQINEEEQLHQFLQLINNHELDVSAMIDIIKTEQFRQKQSNNSTKLVLHIYQEAFAIRLKQIDLLIQSEGVLTNEQMQQLQQIKLFEMSYNKQINKLKFDKFTKWLSQQLNIQPQIQSQKQESILVIENPPESDRNNQINPFIQAEKNLRAEFDAQLIQMHSIQLSDKQYSGQIVSEHLEIQFEERQLLKMKKACLRNRYALFDSHEILLGVIRKQITKEELFTNFLELTFVVGNKTKQTLKECELIFEEPKGLQFWLPEEPMKTQVIKQEKMTCLIAYQHLIFQPLKGQFQWADSQQVYEAKFVVPCLLSQFMAFSPIGRKYFKFIWNKKKDYCWRSEQFKLNTKVIKSILDFKRHNPMLCYLVDLQDFLDLSIKVTNLEKDLKLGGEFTLQDTRHKHYIKIIVRQNSQVVVKVTGFYEAVQVIKCLEFILRE